MSTTFLIEIKEILKNSKEFNAMQKQYILEKITHSNLMIHKQLFDAYHRPGDG